MIIRIHRMPYIVEHDTKIVIIMKKPVVVH